MNKQKIAYLKAIFFVSIYDIDLEPSYYYDELEYRNVILYKATAVLLILR